MIRRATIYVVDDDDAMQRAMRSVGQLLDVPVVAYSSAEGFLAQFDVHGEGCLVMEVKLTGMSGLEVQRKLADSEAILPVIMVSGHADVRIAVEAMSLGAQTLLEKPCGLDELVQHVRWALAVARERQESRAQQAKMDSQLARLTWKEREVLELVATGRTNRQIAESLRLSVRAIEDRRARLMKKLGARSIVELLQLLAG